MSHLGHFEKSGDDTVDMFRAFARNESVAVRMRDNANHTDKGIERRDFAMSMRKANEEEFKRCFVMVKQPNWKAVEDAVMGETNG